MLFNSFLILTLSLFLFSCEGSKCGNPDYCTKYDSLASEYLNDTKLSSVSKETWVSFLSLKENVYFDPELNEMVSATDFSDGILSLEENEIEIEGYLLLFETDSIEKHKPTLFTYFPFPKKGKKNCFPSSGIPGGIIKVYTDYEIESLKTEKCYTLKGTVMLNYDDSIGKIELLGTKISEVK